MFIICFMITDVGKQKYKKKNNYKILRHMKKLYKIHGNIDIALFWSVKYNFLQSCISCRNKQKHC